MHFWRIKALLLHFDLDSELERSNTTRQKSEAATAAAAALLELAQGVPGSC